MPPKRLSLPAPRDDEPPRDDVERARVGLREAVLREVRALRVELLLRARLLDRPRVAPLPLRGSRVSAEIV